MQIPNIKMITKSVGIVIKNALQKDTIGWEIEIKNNQIIDKPKGPFPKE